MVGTHDPAILGATLDRLQKSGAIRTVIDARTMQREHHTRRYAAARPRSSKEQRSASEIPHED
jgi:hypothetical protein